MSDKRPTAEDQLYETLRHDILTLALKPGQKVSETSLSTLYKVGKASTRTALARLVQDGLVSKQVRSSHYVADITLRDIHELFAMRRLLLPEAAALACAAAHSMSKTIIQRVMKDYSGDRSEEVLGICIANRDFVLEMVKGSGNELLYSVASMLEDRALRVMFLNLSAPPPMDVFRRQYQAILDAIAARDASAARAAVLRAIDESEAATMATVMRMPHLQSLNLAKKAD